jgi:hypothetical protein
MVDFLLLCLSIPEGMGSRLGGGNDMILPSTGPLWAQGGSVVPNQAPSGRNPKVSCNFVQDPYLFWGNTM